MAISITSRIRNSMVSLTVILCVLFTGLIFLLVYVIEDQVFINQIKAEQSAFDNVIGGTDAQAIQEWQPNNTNIRRINSVAELPSSVRTSMRERVVAQAGIHEYFDDSNALFIAHLKRQDTGTSYFLLYDVQSLLAVRGSKTALFSMIACLSLLITGLAVLMARRLTKATLAPLSELANALQNEDLDDGVIQLAKQFSADEVGVLTRELAAALERVRKAAQREYEFNRAVSHELRSPIQAAQSATELLQLVCADTNPSTRKPIDRLQRSVAEMNEVAEAFLWLASDRVLAQQERGTIAKIGHTLSAIQLTIPDRDISLNTTLAANFSYPMPHTVLAAVLRSLIRNAVIHGTHSVINVELTKTQISVSNSIGANSSERLSFGMGLSIVQRICDRFGATLLCSESTETRYTASVKF